MRDDRMSHLGTALGLASLLLAVCAGAASAAGGARESASWPRWRGAGFDGTAREAGVFGNGFRLRQRWRRALGSGYSGVVVAEGRAVTMFSDGESDFLVALDADTGREVWRHEIAPSRPGIEGSNPGPISTPAIDSGSVYALGPRGHLVAVRLADGEPLWRVDLVARLGAATPHWGFGTSPLVWQRLLLVETGAPQQRALTAFDRETGAPVWGALADGVNYQSPMLWTSGEETRLLFAGDEMLASLDPVDGRVLWSQAHEGAQFYGQIVNPVRVGEDALLLTNRRGQASLFRVGPDGMERAWSSVELKLNYATPVYSDGYVYGYSGNFLTCIDASTGERVWKSRPPGNGFPILVDSHLVVQTKQGTLHVAEASPQGYRERARLELFDRLVWTPPSFAGRRIFARDSFSEVAAVDVVPGTAGADKATGDEPAGTLPGSRFAAWVARVEAAADPRTQVREWLSEQSAFPVIEGERFAHVVYHGKVQDIALRGGLVPGYGELPMHRVSGTDLYYASFELEPDARVQYQFLRDFEGPIADPRNPPGRDSLVYGGPASLLLMPRAERPEAPIAGQGRHGRLETLPYHNEPVRVGARTWGGRERPLRVYLPPGYDESQRRYPVLYVLYGEQMLEAARLDAVLDSMIGSEIEPLIAVFVPSVSAYEYARSQRALHARMLVEEVVPLVDGRYRTLAAAGTRALLGVDEAGYAVLETALRHPRSFGAVAAQSVLAIAQGREELLEAIETTPRQPLRLYLDWGRYDLRDPGDGTDVPGYGRQLRERLVARGYSVRGREWNDASDVTLWAWRARGALQALFE